MRGMQADGGRLVPPPAASPASVKPGVTFSPPNVWIPAPPPLFSPSCSRPSLIYHLCDRFTTGVIVLPPV